MNYRDNGDNKNMDSNEGSRTSFSREFAIRYDEVERLTEQIYSN